MSSSVQNSKPLKLHTSTSLLPVSLISQVSLICNRDFDIILILMNLAGTPGDKSTHSSLSSSDLVLAIVPIQTGREI